MGNKKCKTVKKGDSDPEKQKEHQYKCKKCNLTAKKESKLCKPTKN